MNSLSIISSTVDKVIGTTPPSSPRPDGFEDFRRTTRSSRLEDQAHGYVSRTDSDATTSEKLNALDSCAVEDDSEDEQKERTPTHLRMALGQRLYMIFLSPWIGAFRWMLSAVTISFNWVLSPIFDDRGMFAPLEPLRKMGNYRRRPVDVCDNDSTRTQPSPRIEITSEDGAPQIFSAGGESMRRVRSRGAESYGGGQEILPRRSIRIRLYNDEKSQKGRGSTSASAVKSPTSPSASLRLTKYPRITGPPMPLLPRKPSPKTLILDLDETLIHSLAKGGRMSSGHMVEVKLDRQHAILYYVHKRPYCDEFLRKVPSPLPLALNVYVSICGSQSLTLLPS